MDSLPPPPNMSPLPILQKNTATRDVVCLETLMLTILLWASLWGVVESCIDRSGLRETDVAVYLLIAAAALAGVYWSDTINACSVL